MKDQIRQEFRLRNIWILLYFSESCNKEFEKSFKLQKNDEKTIFGRFEAIYQEIKSSFAFRKKKLTDLFLWILK